MNNEDWRTSDDAMDMLRRLRAKSLEDWVKLAPQIHRYLVACCHEIGHLIPQNDIQRGLQGAELYFEGRITRDELYSYDWYLEAEAFGLDYETVPEQVTALIESIDEVRDMEYEDARELLKFAAYFAEWAVMYDHRSKPQRLTKSDHYDQFLSATLLRQFIRNPFGE